MARVNGPVNLVACFLKGRKIAPQLHVLIRTDEDGGQEWLLSSFGLNSRVVRHRLTELAGGHLKKAICLSVCCSVPDFLHVTGVQERGLAETGDWNRSVALADRPVSQEQAHDHAELTIESTATMLTTVGKRMRDREDEIGG